LFRRVDVGFKLCASSAGQPIENGHAGGLDRIANLRLGVDDIELVGYSPNSNSSAIGTQVSDGHGGTLLALPDSTRIELIGVSHATMWIFS